MPRVHFLNVNQGDCIVLEHNSGRVTVFDVSAGNLERKRVAAMEAIAGRDITPAKGNYRMCQHPTNPIDYLKNIGVAEIWRFILSHPDMDHLDGFNALLNEFAVLNFWDSGARRKKPDFSNNGGYKEEDWDRYAKTLAGNEPGTKTVFAQAGARFKYANEDDTENGVGDALHILAPDKELMDAANASQDFNDASYVEPISKSFKQYQQGCELHKAQEVVRIVLPARHNTALPLEPGKKALDLPPPRVAT